MSTIKYLFILLAISLTGGYTHAQTSVAKHYATRLTPKTSTIFYRIGESQLVIKLLQYGDTKDIVYINLHADEMTSVNAAQRLLEQQGGYMIKIENNNKRNIRFRLRGRYYQFDPNRMFSRDGASQTLRQLGRTSPEAIDEVAKLGERIIQLLPSTLSWVIALHNNTEGKFGINSYLPGADRRSDAIDAYADPLQDTDDIFLTTDHRLYERLTREKFNTILQDNENARKDGSLSIYCGDRNINYLNCETQHGREEQYFIMLQLAVNEMARLAIGTQNYRYTVNQVDSSFHPPTTDIYFGERKVGRIVNASSDSTGIAGELEIDKDFPLYSNMDFFLLPDANGAWRIEIRVDPTRERNAIDTATGLVTLITRPTE